MKMILAAVALLAVSACTGQEANNNAELVRLGCEGYALQLNIAADLNREGLLPENAVAVIDDVVAVVTPVCTADEPPVGAVQIVSTGAGAIAAAIVAISGEES